LTPVQWSLDMKNPVMAGIAAALLVLTGASVWEGAASIAPLGDLPDEGFYAATNSFPRNTVVDITNLETGQSIRVIVAAGLETPGLLAVLSRDAAGMIGLRSRSIGRIRMTQPSDPVAFSRFTEGLASNGDPDYDPRALVNADPLARQYAQGPAASETAPETAYPSDTGAGGDESYDPRYDEIVDLPGPFSPAAAAGRDDGIVRENGPAAIAAADPWERPVPTEYAETTEAPVWETEPDLDISDEPEILSAAEPPVEITPEEPPPVFESAEPEAEIVQPEPPAETSLEFALIPAEKQPPEDAPVYEIPPELIIAPIPGGGDPVQAAGPEPVMDESQFVDPAGASPEETAALPEASPAPAPEAAPPLPGLFSVPLISALEQGKYYVQIGAFNRAETVEALIAKAGNGYPLAVQNGGSEESPVYRLLVGPVNLGESGALIQRFKSIGYSDAFVRRGN
jgi:hypothetical protein